MNRREQQQAEDESARQNSDYLKAKRLACKECQGVGFKTVYFLQTYHNKSLTCKKRAYLPHIESEHDAHEYAVKVREFLERNAHADRQQVLSASQECICRK